MSSNIDNKKEALEKIEKIQQDFLFELRMIKDKRDKAIQEIFRKRDEEEIIRAVKNIKTID